MENASKREEKRRKCFLFNEIFNVIKIYFLLPELRGVVKEWRLMKNKHLAVLWNEWKAFDIKLEPIILLTFQSF